MPTIKKQTYTHLTSDDRYMIWSLKRSGNSIADIAKELDRSESTIRREVARNAGKRGYRPEQAGRLSSQRRYSASAVPRKVIPLLPVILEKLQLGWSPEQVSGWMDLHRLGKISFQAIYHFIHTHKRMLSVNITHYLRRKGKRYKPRNSLEKRGKIPNRVDIDLRPDVVNNKERFGDWEADTVVGKDHKGAILTLVERKSKFMLMAPLKHATAEAVEKEMVALLKPMRNLVHSITMDNGKEFTNHEQIGQKLNADMYFTKPYSSWQKGLVEHTNMLIREYLPKGTSFVNLTWEKLEQIQKTLNERPRKVLDYSKPEDIINVLLDQNPKRALRI